MLLLGYLTDTKIFQMGNWNEHWNTEVCKLLDMPSQKYREIFRVLLGFRECSSHKQHRTRRIWEARTHFHVASAPYLLHLHSYFSPHNLSLFPRLLPPSTFQGKHYKYSFKQVFFAHFGCLRRPVVMAPSRSIFLKNRTWTSWGMVSFSTERNLFRNKTEQSKTPSKSFLSLKCPPSSAIFFPCPFLYRSNGVSWKICWTTKKFQYRAVVIWSLHTSPVCWREDWDSNRVLHLWASIFSIHKIKFGLDHRQGLFQLSNSINSKIHGSRNFSVSLNQMQN